MKNILDQLFLPFLSQIGLYAGVDIYDFRRSGLCYRPDPCIGTGYIWIYPVDNLYAVTIYDVVFKEDISFQYEHPAFLSLGNYNSSIAKLMYDEVDSHTESLLGYVGHEEVFQQSVQKNVALNCIGISLTPEFYENYLTGRFSRDFQKLPDIISRLNGSGSIPEVTMALKQIQGFQPSGGIAKAYYESKVLEVIAIIMQWSENQVLFSENNRIPDWELESIYEVSNYLNENYKRHIPLEVLARSACMSHNKMTHRFKQVHGVTITEYIQNLRIEKAKDMLLNSDREIGEIANEVGYKLHRSFSEVFKQATKFTPREFRKKMF